MGHADAAANDILRNLQRLRESLRARNGLRWRYRQPWLLVIGPESAAVPLFPNFKSSEWDIVGETVILWHKPFPDGQLNAAWLKKLAKMRRGRPVDAVLYLVDDATEANRLGVATANMQLARIAELLHWSAPTYVISVLDVAHGTHAVAGKIGCELPSRADADAIAHQLETLHATVSDQGTRHLARDINDLHQATIAQSIESESKSLAQLVAEIMSGPRAGVSVRGIFFVSPRVAANQVDLADGARENEPLWRHIGECAKSVYGRRVGLHPVTVFSVAALGALGIWCAGLLVSGISNAHQLALTRQALTEFKRAPDTAIRLRSLLALQQRIEFYEYRVQHRTPLFSRFGLNHDQDMLDALWKPYAREVRSQLIASVQQDIEAQLVDLIQMPTTELDDQTNRLTLDGHAALKTYLMMAEPARVDVAFMTPQLVRHWNGGKGLLPGEKLDLSQRLLSFYAQHLSAHPDWRIAPREALIGGARQALLAVIGVKNSEDTIYQGMLDAVGRKYSDQTLASLTPGTDTRGLLRTTASVPGIYTRQAWDGTIEAAIDAAAKSNGVSADWVIGAAVTANAPSNASPDALRAALRARYFADYAEHWQTFMNSIASEPATSLPAAIAQLKLIADARQSPVIALMKSLEYQGGAGAVRTSLSDTLVNKAQNLIGKKDDTALAAAPDPAGPLGASFGPVLRLVAQGNAASGASSDLSLQRFIERVTSLRLRLQQIADSSDANSEAQQVAQALFQGKNSELADTLGYAQLVAASLGEQWAGMGQALFVKPVVQATQTVLEPAQASLNDAWRQTIVATWNRSFAGRYPFANTANDVSLPELSRFLRPQGGLIGAFLSTQLAGVLTLQGDQWVPASGGNGAGNAARTVDPAFLDAINLLQRIAAHLLAQGEPQYTFELKPVPAPGVTDTRLTVDGQTLHYYNQQEAWQTLTWPSSEPQKAGTRLEWQTEQSGTNLNLEFGGRWAWVRMLERARVMPVDSATYQLTWQATPRASDAKSAAEDHKADQPDDPDTLTAQGPLVVAPASLTHPLTYLIRTDVGKGPLALLALRNFVLPTRIFMGRGTPSRASGNAAMPPPLPPAARAAARRAAVAIPSGPAPQ
ncbi:type VI secretion system membrane subunit [Burkholderia sp. 3C]